MNPEVKRMWIDALRSGKYQQGRFNLRDGDNYCCLGVLCQLAIADGVPLEVNGNDDGHDLFSYDKDRQYLPKRVIDWAGLSSRNPYIVSIGSNLSQLNDHDNKTFEDIANIIEKEL